MGDVVEIYSKGNYVLYAVTKERHQDKPTIGDFVRTMKALEAKCVELNITKIAVLRLGCGLDQLEWPLVKQALTECFKGLTVTLRVYTHPPNMKA